MKKAKLILALLVVLAVCFGLVACEKPTAEYKLDKTTLSLVEGKTQQLTVSSSLDNEFSVEYKTSDATVATVSNSGLVTAVKAGKATITATVDGKELTCSVTVTAAQTPVTYEYKLSETAISIVEGGYKDISVTVTPNKEISVTYTSANTAIATVNANGRVTAIAAGETTVTAAVDGQTLTCKVTVEKTPPTYTLKAVGTPLVEGGKTLIEKGTTLKFEVTSSEADDEFTVQWSTSDDKIATIAQDGTVTAVANGDVTVNAKIGDVTKTCAVQVFTYQYTFQSAITLNYGDTYAQLTVSVDHGKTLAITYVLENEDVVSIDNDGNTTINGAGTTTVTIKDGDKVVGECEITVNAVFTAQEMIQMHVGGESEWTIAVNPTDTVYTATFAVEEGADVVSISEQGKITALKDGVAKVSATIGSQKLVCDVVVNNVNAMVSQKDLDQQSVENLSGDNVAYWENYIENEVNFKNIASDEEDVIEAILSGKISYLPDYAKLVWTDGSSSCAKPSKPDGWSEGATIQVTAPGQEGVKVTLKIKVVAGATQIKVFTGVFKGTCTATLYNGETAITSYKMEHFDLMTRELLTFDVDVVESGEITIELVLTNAKADNSFITLAGVSVSGSTYRLEESSKRLAPQDTAAIVMTKDGAPMTEGVTYEIIEGNEFVTLDTATGVVTAVTLGTAKIAVTADGRTRIFTVDVGYAYSLEETKVALHVGDTHQIVVNSDPEGATISAQFESSDPSIATVSDSGLVTAVANGTVVITVKVDGKELELLVTISDIVVTTETSLLEMNRDNPIDITEGAEYWEQYIANGEVNHKQYVTAEEDIIHKTSTVDGNYLSDYKAFLAWHDGANQTTCSCGNCNKETQNGGDGGWTDGGTKAMAVNVKDAVIALQFKLYAGESVIKIYTGGYNLVGRVQLKLGDQVIAEATFDNRSKHVSHMVMFTVDSVNACEVTAELVMIDDYNDAGHSCITLAAASVSGSVYQLEKAEERLVENGTTQITLNKDGVALTEGVSYEVVVNEGETALVSVDANGLVTAIGANGVAKVKVTADGRVRYFTVEIGYDYSIDNEGVTLKPGESHQINVISNPAGSTATINYSSDNAAVATVDENGLITAVGNGTAKITVTVEGKQFTVDVTVSGIQVAMEEKDVNGAFVNLDSEEVVYWEHYLYNEKASKTSDRDLIAGEVDGKRGDPNYAAHMHFTNAQGAKDNSYIDGAYHKYSWGANFSFDVTIPQGTYEIRVYTGAWENTANKVSLWDGDSQLQQTTLPRTGGGITKLVVFTVTVPDEKVLTLKLDALEGDNCRLAAIAIVDPSVTSSRLTPTVETVTGGEINLTEKGTLDWVAYSDNIVRKAGGSLISTDVAVGGGASGQGTDYKANLTWTDGEGTVEGNTPNFKWNDNFLKVNVNVNATTKKVTLYLSGWESTYALYMTDKNGTILHDSIVCVRQGDSIAVAVTFDINVTEADVYTFQVCKVNGNNVGLAAITVAD